MLSESAQESRLALAESQLETVLRTSLPEVFEPEAAVDDELRPRLDLVWRHQQMVLDARPLLDLVDRMLLLEVTSLKLVLVS